jgi:poly(3-hydroxybutyrate) depolymerase
MLSRRCFLFGSAPCSGLYPVVEKGRLPGISEDGPGPGPRLLATRPGVFRGSVRAGGRRRTFRLAVPPHVSEATPLPLLFVFHGFRQDGTTIARITGFDELARRHGFLAVYPDGLFTRWNLRDTGNNEDLALVLALRRVIQSRYRVDVQRRFAVGYSAGGYFTHLLAARRASPWLAAAAVHSGGLGELARRGLRARRKYPVFITHGSRDGVVPVEEGRRARDQYVRERHEVTYTELAGAGHEWASAAGISERIWEFCAAHPLSS